jgi:hypothetical protein
LLKITGNISLAWDIMATQRRSKSRSPVDQYGTIGIRAVAAAGRWNKSAKSGQRSQAESPDARDQSRRGMRRISSGERPQTPEQAQGERQMTGEDQRESFTDKTAKAAREATDREAAATQKEHAATVEGVRELSLKLIDMAHVNTEAAFEFARQMASAEAPSDWVGVCSEHIRKQFELMTNQTRELAALGQRIATAGTTPMMHARQEFTKST